MKFKVYKIRFWGHLDESWSEWFDGMTFSHHTDGTTTLTGNVRDHAALFGFLKKINDLGLALISVNPVDGDKINE